MRSSCLKTSCATSRRACFPLEAAIKGSQEIGFTVLSITLSLVAVFIPILLMGGVVGRFFFSFAVTISMAIMFSGFIALTLTPMLCARMLSHHEGHEAKPGMLARAFEAGYDAMATAYRVSLDWSLRHRGLMLLLTLGTMVATAWAFTTVKKGFLPTEDTSIIIVRTEAQSDIAFPAMLARQRLVADAVRADPDVLYINSNVAATAFNPTINRGSIFVQLKPRHERAGRATITDVQARLRRRVTGIVGIRAFPVPLQNLRIGSRSGAAAYQYTLSSVDREQLYTSSGQLIERLKVTPGFADVTSDLELGARQVTIDVDRDALARYGVSMDTLRSTLYSTFGTRKIATVFTSANDYAVIVEAEKSTTARSERPQSRFPARLQRPAGPLRFTCPRHAWLGADRRSRVRRSFRPSP